MTTSGLYASLTIPVEPLIREAFERMGIPGELTEYQKLDAAVRSLNLMLKEWMTRGVNLWTLQTALMPLVPRQGTYPLPPQVNDITQVNLRTSFRQLGGTAASNKPTEEGAGSENAFDGKPQTACTQTQANGTISYDFGNGNTQVITLVGIQNNDATQQYTLTISGAQGTASSVPLLTLPLQTYPVNPQGLGLIQWFEIPTPGAYQIYSVTETGDAILNIQEIYFNTMIRDTPLSAVSRSEYLSYPLPTQVGRPSVYYLDRQITPQLFLWPTPSSSYTCLVYAYEQMMEDVGTVTNTMQIPARFYEALIWGLAWHMACKYAPDKAENARAYYDATFNQASTDDSEGTPVTIYADFSGRGGR